MAITYVSGSYGTSGVVASVSSASAAVNAGSSVGRLVVAVILFRDPNSRTVASATYGGVAMSKATNSSYNSILASEVWYLADAASGSNTLAVTFSGTVQQAVVYGAAFAGAATSAVLDNVNSGTGNSNAPSVSVTPSENDCLVVGGIVHEIMNALTVGSGETALVNADHGAWVTSVSYAIQTTAAAQAVNWSATGSDTWACAVASFRAGVSNAAPTLTPNTADASSFGTTPTLEITGSDADSDDLRYQVQISTNSGFLPNGVQVTDSEINSGSGTLTIHPNPDASATTWEGFIHVDDRPGQVFQGSGGVLDKIEFDFGPHESTPADTNGYYLARVYAISGVRGDNVPIWSASTTKTVGQMVRNTSGANANQQFLYVCTTAGTTGSTEPTWTEVENATYNDGTVTWEAHRGAGPLNYAAPADTPTPDWLAQSDAVAYSPGAADPGWKACNFTGANRIWLEAGTWYCAILDWRPANRTISNAITVSARIGSTHGGNCYIDGYAANNNGPRVGDDTMFRLYEDHILLDKVSGTDAGFVNTVTGGDTDPFNAGEKVSYTVQAGDALAATTYYWRARVIDPGGINQWSTWTTTRFFTVTEATSVAPANVVHAHTADGVSLAQEHILAVAGVVHAQAADAANLIVATQLAVADAIHVHTADAPTVTQAHQLVAAGAGHAHVVDSASLAQVHNLAVAEAGHAHAANGVDLTQLHNILVAGVLHEHVADALVLEQVHLLAPAAAGHAHTVDSVTLGVAGSLGVANANHAHAVNATALTQVHNLLLADAAHAHAAGSIGLTQAHNLLLANAAHAHGVDSVDLAQVHNILAAGVLHGHVADNVALELADSLLVAPATHGHTANSPTLTQVHYLTVSGGHSNHTATAINFVGEQPESGALMPIAGVLGRQFAGIPTGTLHGTRFAAAVQNGVQKIVLAQAPTSGVEGIRFSLATESSATGTQFAGRVCSGVDAAPIINSPVAGQQGR